MNLINAHYSEIAKIIHDYIERDIGTEYDLFNSPPPPIYIGPVKVKTLKDRLEETKMNATSTENFHDVITIDFELQTFPNHDAQDKFIISATNRDDIFCFVFDGPYIADTCRKAGLFTGWEKDQKIRELEKENKELKAKSKDISDDNALLLETNKKLKQSDMLDKEAADYWSKEHDTLLERFRKLQEENEELQRKYDLEKAANEAHHRFFHQYAGKGTEIEFNYAIDDTDEVSYVIVNKERYQTLKDNSNRCVMINGRSYTPSQMVDRIVELEELKTPTIENFADEEPSSRRDILRCAEKCVCGQREQDYGTPESNFQLIADLWNQYLFKEPGAKEVFGIGPMDVAMMMGLMKIARIRNGGGSGDSFVDLAGYAACGGEIWASNKETNGDSN